MIKLKKIYIDQRLKSEIIDSLILSDYPFELLSEDKLNDLEAELDYISAKDYLYITSKQDGFAKPCPGTKEYICCNYAVINAQEGCFLNCSYCILQGYLSRKIPRIYANFSDILQDTARYLKTHSCRRIGTGELSDSLVYDHITGFSRKYIEFFSHFPETIFEFKTKTLNISNLLEVDAVPSNAMVSWSVNTERVIREEEHRAPSLQSRLEAARKIRSRGFRTGFHFDPVLLYDSAEEDYISVIHRIFDCLSPNDISYISLGCFRYLPQMKGTILDNYPETSIFNGEFFRGTDGKMRYFRPLREAMVKKLVSCLRSCSPDLNLYFCMESSSWWKNILHFHVNSNEDAQRQIDSLL